MPNSASSLKPIRLLGHLILPHPSTYFAAEDGWSDYILECLPELKKLDERDLAGILFDAHNDYPSYPLNRLKKIR